MKRIMSIILVIAMAFTLGLTTTMAEELIIEAESGITTGKTAVENDWVNGVWTQTMWADATVTLTAEVAEAGNYLIQTSAYSSATLTTTVNGTQTTTEISSAWGTWVPYDIGVAALNAGANEIVISVNSVCALDYIKLTPTTDEVTFVPVEDKDPEEPVETEGIILEGESGTTSGQTAVEESASCSGEKTQTMWEGGSVTFYATVAAAGQYKLQASACASAILTATVNGTVFKKRIGSGWGEMVLYDLGIVTLNMNSNEITISTNSVTSIDYIKLVPATEADLVVTEMTLEGENKAASTGDVTVEALETDANGTWIRSTLTMYGDSSATWYATVPKAGAYKLQAQAMSSAMLTATVNNDVLTKEISSSWGEFVLYDMGTVVLNQGTNEINIAVSATCSIDYIKLVPLSYKVDSSIAIGEDNVITGSLRNISGGALSFTAAVAVKKGEQLVNIALKPITFETAGDADTFETELTLGEGETAELYCWDAGTLTPLAAKKKISRNSVVRLYVSNTGSDSADGLTESGAVKTLAAAQAIARTYAAENDVIVNIGEGTYYISEPVAFTSADTPNGEYHVSYRGSENGKTVISGGAVLEGVWQQHEGNVWKIEVPQADVRQFYVNGTKAVMARTDSIYNGMAFVDDAEDDTATQDGVYVEITDVLSSLAGAQSAEAVCDAKWTRDIFPIKSITDIDGVAAIVMKQPALANAMAVSAGLENTLTDYGFYVQNDVALIDEPGEFAFDRVNKVLYYYPRVNETLADAVCVAGASEGLVTVDGAADALVKNLTIENITFENGTWLSPSENGLVVRQGDSISSDAIVDDSTDEMLPPQIKVNYADNFIFRNNTIKNVGSGGIGIIEGVKNSKITDNIITDTAAGAIIVGSFAHASNDAKMVSDCVIDNNYIRNTGLEYASSPAIEAFYIKKTQITHNDVANTSLAGISLGWGWNPNWSRATGNYIAYNKVENVVTSPLNDSAPMYVIGNQGDSIIEYNYFGASHEYEGTHKTVAEHGGVYFDNGTSSVYLRNNVIEGAANWFFGFWQEDSFYNKIGTNYTNINSYYAENLNDTNEFTEATIESSWSAEAQEIINNAGLRK